MNFKFLLFAALLMSSLSAFGQADRMTEQAARELYGAPQMERNQGDRQIWLYPNGARVVIANGVVVESNIGASQSAPQPVIETTPRVSEKHAPAPAPTRTLEKPKPKPQPKPATKNRESRPAPTDVWEFMTGSEPLASALLLAAMALSVIAAIWFTVVTFNVSIFWGLACLFIPFASLVFLFVHWQDAKKPFLFSLFVCCPLVFAGVWVAAN